MGAVRVVLTIVLVVTGARCDSTPPQPSATDVSPATVLSDGVPTPAAVATGCGIDADDLQRWFAWETIERTTPIVDGVCVFDAIDGEVVTISIGSTSQFVDRLADLYESMERYELFDPEAERVFGQEIAGRRITSFGVHGSDAVIVDVETSVPIDAADPQSATVLEPSVLPGFALDRLDPETVRERVAAVDRLQPSPLQCGIGFAALDAAGTAQLDVVPPLDGFDPDRTTSGNEPLELSARTVVTFGVGLDAHRCTDAVRGPGPVAQSWWPITSGTIEWTFERVPKADHPCGFIATVTLRDVAVERPDARSITLPPLTVVNDRFGFQGVDGCILGIESSEIWPPVEPG